MRQIDDRARVVATGRIGRVVQSNADGTLHLVRLEGGDSTRGWYRDSELQPVSSLLHFLRANSSRVFRGAAAWAALMVPVSHLYRTTYRLSRLQAMILRPLIGLTPYRQDPRQSIMVAWVLNSWLQQLNKVKRAFPIEVKTEGQRVVIDASLHPGGLVICSVHVPLVHAVLHSLIKIGVPPVGVVAGEPEMKHGKIPVWGLQEDLPGIPENQNSLLKMRRILRQGGTVFALIDTETGDSPSHNIFRLIGKAGARAVLATVALRPTGEINVEYSDPPDPFCETEKSIMANAEFLQAKVKRSMASGV
jgi:hypothetical protein